MSYRLIRDITSVNRTVLSNKDNKYIVIHYTGNKTDTARANANYFRSINRGASAHYFVDKSTVYQVVEDKDSAWSVGRNYGSNNLFGIVNNNNSISIEMCSNDGAIASETFENTVALTKELTKKYGIPVDHVIRHYDCCSKRCPGWEGWLPGNESLWNKFKAEIGGSASPAPTHLYRVRKSWSDASSQIGAFSNLENAKAACKSGYSVYDENGNTVYSNGASTPTPQQTSKPTPVPTPAPTPVDTNVDVYYRVRANGRWLPEVKNLNDYAGIEGQKITDVAIRVTKGSVKYRVHVLGGGWLGYVTGCDISDGNNGYAGNGRAIDAIEVYYSTPSDIAHATGYKKAQYRVSTTASSGYYSWQYDNEVNKSAGMDGYAGCFGKAIDKVQICIK